MSAWELDAAMPKRTKTVPGRTANPRPFARGDDRERDRGHPVRVLYRYRFGTAEFDETSFELRVNGVTVDIQHKPLQVLRLLLQRSGELVRKDEFHAVIWAGTPTVDNVLGNALSKLRAALGEENASRIVTRAPDRVPPDRLHREGFHIPGKSAHDDARADAPGAKARKLPAGVTCRADK